MLNSHCRLRPLLSSEQHKGIKLLAQFLSQGKVELTVARTKPIEIAKRKKKSQAEPEKITVFKRKAFHMDMVYPPSVSQTELFSDLRGYVQSAVDGHHSSIVSFGQKGGGKTFTMFGPEGDVVSSDTPEHEKGLVFRAGNEAFRLFALECGDERANDEDFLPQGPIPDSASLESSLPALLRTGSLDTYSARGEAGEKFDLSGLAISVRDGNGSGTGRSLYTKLQSIKPNPAPWEDEDGGSTSARPHSTEGPISPSTRRLPQLSPIPLNETEGGGGFKFPQASWRSQTSTSRSGFSMGRSARPKSTGTDLLGVPEPKAEEDLMKAEAFLGNWSLPLPRQQDSTRVGYQPPASPLGFATTSLNNMFDMPPPPPGIHRSTTGWSRWGPLDIRARLLVNMYEVRGGSVIDLLRPKTQ